MATQTLPPVPNGTKHAWGVALTCLLSENPCGRLRSYKGCKRKKVLAVALSLQALRAKHEARPAVHPAAPARNLRVLKLQVRGRLHDSPCRCRHWERQPAERRRSLKAEDLAQEQAAGRPHHRRCSCSKPHCAALQGCQGRLARGALSRVHGLASVPPSATPCPRPCFTSDLLAAPGASCSSGRPLGPETTRVRVPRGPPASQSPQRPLRLSSRQRRGG